MPVTLATHAMGTRFELVLDGGDPHRLRAAGEAALREIEECHHRFNLFDPGSWLNTINRRAAHEPFALDALTFDLLETCQQVHHDSGGAFDITVAPLMRAWGFHGECAHYPPPFQGGAGGGSEREVLPTRSSATPPLSRPLPPGERGSDTETLIEAVKACVGMKHVVLDRDNHTVRFAVPGVTLDLGGIAKGFAIDQAIGLLREFGVGCALLHGGTSTVATIGSPPGEHGWRVKLHTANQPADDTSYRDRGPAPVVCLNNQSLSVSAPHGRTIDIDGETLGHVLDPRTGYRGRPADCGEYAAAIGESACLTDAWATALLVLGQPPKTMPRSIQALLPDRTSTAPTLEDAYA